MLIRWCRPPSECSTCQRARSIRGRGCTRQATRLSTEQRARVTLVLKCDLWADALTSAVDTRCWTVGACSPESVDAPEERVVAAEPVANRFRSFHAWSIRCPPPRRCRSQQPMRWAVVPCDPHAARAVPATCRGRQQRSAGAAPLASAVDPDLAHHRDPSATAGARARSPPTPRARRRVPGARGTLVPFASGPLCGGRTARVSQCGSKRDRMFVVERICVLPVDVDVEHELAPLVTLTVA